MHTCTQAVTVPMTRSSLSDGSLTVLALCDGLGITLCDGLDIV